MSNYKIETVEGLHEEGFKAPQFVNVAEVESREDQIAELKRIQMALREALEWVIHDYECMCGLSNPPSENWRERVEMAFSALRLVIVTTETQGNEQ